MTHVRKFIGRFVQTSPGVHISIAETICGGSTTPHDLTGPEAKRELRDGWKDLTCVKCRSLMAQACHWVRQPR